MNNNSEKIVPDILIPYKPVYEENTNYVIIHVRPETNKINYESLILQAIRGKAKVLYMANLNGNVLNHDKIMKNHYYCQYQFALHGKKIMAAYPEMIILFEKKFGVSFSESHIYGAYEFLKLQSGKIDCDVLFDYFVENEDFLNFYGQTIKKIENVFVINYDIPAVLENYSHDADILVMLVKITDPSVSFSALNYSLYKEFSDHPEAPIFGKDQRHSLRWADLVKRTYHISQSNVQAMYDMSDYVYFLDGRKVLYSYTPLGLMLIKQKVIKPAELEKKLDYLKHNPMIYISTDSGKELIYLMKLGNRINPDGTKQEFSLNETAELFSKIIYPF